MSRKILLLVAVLAIAFTGITFAAVENIKVSGDITMQAITRDLSLGGTSAKSAVYRNGATVADSEDYMLSQIRLRFDADLTENVSAVVRLINERPWGSQTSDNGNSTDIDLDLGYIQLKEVLYQPLTLIIGRQNLYYGNGLIVGDPDTSQASDSALYGQDLSLRKSFDAVRAILDFSPYTIDIIYAKIHEGNLNQNDDQDLMGFNLAYDWASYNGVTELYFFYKNKANYALGVEDPKNETFVIGSRVQASPNDHWTLGLEGAYQFGDAQIDTDNNGTLDGHAHLSAWAAQAIAEYKFLNKYKAKTRLAYTFLSGDDPSSNNYNGWDPMFEDQVPAEIINILGANTNAHLIQLSGSFMPREDITLGALYCHAQLAESSTRGAGVTNTWYSPNVGFASGNTYVIDNGDRSFGDEIDVYALYDYTEDVQFKLTGAWFIPGDFFASQNDDVAYSIRGMVSVNF